MWSDAGGARRVAALRRFLGLRAVALGLVALASTAGEAFEGRLKPVGTATVVVIWRHAKAQDEGTALIRAGINKTDPARLLPFIACIVAPGTRAMTTSPRIFSHDVKVLEGEHKGCVGSVPTEALKPGAGW